MLPIRISNLSKTYRGKKRKRIQALRDLSLDIRQGEVFGFLGPNGAGKSTTIKVLMGMIRPSAGEARLLTFLPRIPQPVCVSGTCRRIQHFTIF